jgi:hypothetical protein
MQQHRARGMFSFAAGAPLVPEQMHCQRIDAQS